jgi:excisionase family DNA binding protein
MNPATFPATPQHEKLLTPGDVARWLGVSPGWVRDHATRKQPHLPAVKLGKLLRFRSSDVQAFIEKWVTRG